MVEILSDAAGLSQLVFGRQTVPSFIFACLPVISTTTTLSELRWMIFPISSHLSSENVQKRSVDPALESFYFIRAF